MDQRKFNWEEKLLIVFDVGPVSYCVGHVANFFLVSLLYLDPPIISILVICLLQRYTALKAALLKKVHLICSPFMFNCMQCLCLSFICSATSLANTEIMYTTISCLPVPPIPFSIKRRLIYSTVLLELLTALLECAIVARIILLLRYFSPIIATELCWHYAFCFSK